MRVLSIDDLRFRAPPGKRLAVLGDPIGHSLSPAMHHAALAQMARENAAFGDWAYEAVHVPAERLPEALSLLHRESVAGINLTIPHKVEALSLVEEIDASVRPMGAVNTLIRTESGYRGTNTDGFGILKAIEEAFAIGVKDRDVWLFGAGGAARGIAVACLQAGCKRLNLVNRGRDRLHALKRQLDSLPPESRGCLRFFSLDDLQTDVEQDALCINATALGLKESDPSPIGEAFLSAAAFVYDTTYGCANQLRAACAKGGIAYADGLSMLVWQGVRSLEIWTGARVPAGVMRKAAEDRLKEKTKHG